jgi:hypothetical protein
MEDIANAIVAIGEVFLKMFEEIVKVLKLFTAALSPLMAEEAATLFQYDEELRGCADFTLLRVFD